MKGYFFAVEERILFEIGRKETEEMIVQQRKISPEDSRKSSISGQLICRDLDDIKELHKILSEYIKNEEAKGGEL